MQDNFDAFTDEAQRLLAFAQEEAMRLNHHYIGTEHLLLGLIREPDSVAARILTDMHVQLPKVRSAVEYILARGAASSRGLAPRARIAIELAVDEARRLHHDYVGTEHLLLGLVREGEGIGAAVLESLGVGVTLEKARAQVAQRAKGGIEPESEPT